MHKNIVQSFFSVFDIYSLSLFLCPYWMKSYPPVLVSGRRKNIKMPGLYINAKKIGLKHMHMHVYNLCNLGFHANFRFRDIFTSLQWNRNPVRQFSQKNCGLIRFWLRYSFFFYFSSQGKVLFRSLCIYFKYFWYF